MSDMTCDARADQDLAPDMHLLPGDGEPGRDDPSPRLGDAGALGQAVSTRLFSAGLDLNFALMLCRDGPAADRLRHAVTELDEALGDLRHLMLAVLGPSAGMVPDSARAVTVPGPAAPGYPEALTGAPLSARMPGGTSGRPGRAMTGMIQRNQARGPTDGMER